jgi:drug/metabolite transporter (DMT)-like permease
MLYGLLNVSIYLGLYIIALQKLSAGLGTLAVGVNPVIISFMAALFFRQKITVMGFVSLGCCLLGVLIAAWPLLKTSYASVDGLLLIFVSMLAYSGAAIFYARRNWKGLHILTINAWQTLFGGIFLLPFLFYTFHESFNHLDVNFWIGTLWLAIPVSIGAVQCWLLLLKYNTAKAAYWLFLCPVFGFVMAAILLKEPLSWFTLVGVILVIGGLYVAQKHKVAIDRTVRDR